MPVYNGEAYMGRAIESLLAQTFDDFELIIVDNGSKDQSPKIAATYAKSDHRVRVVTSTVNRGASWNFERVFRRARGRYFAWTAVDDYWDERFVGACVAQLEAHPRAVTCVSHIQPVTSSGALSGEPLTGMAVEGEQIRSRWQAALKSSLLHSATYGVMRREAVGRTRLLPPYLGSDHVFMTELVLQGEVLEIPEVLAFKLVPGEGEAYRSHSEALEYLGGLGGAPWFLWLRMTKELVAGARHVRPEGCALALLSMDAITSYFATSGYLNDAKHAVVRLLASARR